MRAELYAKDRKREFFQSIRNNLEKEHRGATFLSGLDLGNREVGGQYMQMVKGRNEREVEAWLLDSNFTKGELLKKYTDVAAEEQLEFVMTHPID